jgi:uncharacterized membrane protein YdjX (TVP38/TMEM64 family)
MEISINPRINKRIQIALNVLKVLSGVLILIMAIYGYRNNLFTSQENLTHFIKRFGAWGPFILTVYIAIQVIIPVLPGSLMLVVSPLLFGAFRGFLYSYIGILIGSVLAFLLAKRYGQVVLSIFVNEKYRQIFDKYTSKKQFTINFALAIFLPGFPDDYLTYLAGTTSMSLRTFLIIIVPCKIPGILLYSLGIPSLYKYISKHIF